MRMLRRTAVLALLSLLLAAPWASAEPAAKATGGFWSFLVRIWIAEGCIMDPLGCPAQTSTDEGCRLDPLGCPAQPSTDAGCHIDPLGGCKPGQ